MIRPRDTGERVRSHGTLSLGLAAGLIAVAVAASGGTDLGTNTAVQAGLLVVAAGLLAWLLVIGGFGPARGWVAVLLFVALAGLTYASLIWSVDPGTSWLEANRTLSYLAAFAGAVALARLAPGHWRGLVGALALTSLIVCGYSLLAKILPASLDRGDPLGRLNVPLGYWNAVGLMAALGIPPWLWLGAQAGSSRWIRSLAPAALALLITVLLMSYSRGALAVAVISTGVWFALVSLRLRGATVLALGVGAAAAILAWALPNHGLSADNLTLAVRESAGHPFGWFALGVLLATCAVGVALARWLERWDPPEALRRAIGRGALVALALVPVAVVVYLATSSRGFTGEISHIWSTATSSKGGVGNRPGRLLNLSNGRTGYWHDGLVVGGHHPILGTGARGFSVAHLRYTKQAFTSPLAHNYLIETFADLGLVGVALSLALLVAWAMAAGRALGVRGPPLRSVEERAGLATLFCVVIAFGLHQLIDWTWFVPGTAVPAMVAAGWLAGRGWPSMAGAAPARRRLGDSPGIGMALLALLALLVAAVWFTIQPWRASRQDAAAASALVRGDSSQALTDARQAVATNPLALDPLYVLSAVYQARGQAMQARAELVKAVRLQPENPSSWQSLGSYDLQRGQRALALSELEHALRLAPLSSVIQALVAQAKGEGPRGP